MSRTVAEILVKEFFKHKKKEVPDNLTAELWAYSYLDVILKGTNQVEDKNVVFDAPFKVIERLVRDGFLGELRNDRGEWFVYLRDENFYTMMQKVLYELLVKPNKWKE